MRKILVITLLAITSFTVHSQTSSDVLKIHDTRDVNDAPNFNNYSIRADFKLRTTIGVPGNGTYSTNLTISPWRDDSGDYNHQLNFNDGGIYHRIGAHSSENWSGWQKLLMEDTNGNVGIGTENPIAKLDVGDLSQNTLKSVLARLDEGNNVGDGTYLGVKSYQTQPVNEKSFSLEHKFYGQINSSINFYRGGSQIGGSLGISVYDGREIARFFDWGLNLAGTIRAKEVKIEATGWSDFVFDKNYDLPKLSDVEKHINDNRHLPGIPSEKEVLENGVNVVDMQAKLLQKIEELTLYVIEQDKKIEEQNKRIKELENR